MLELRSRKNGKVTALRFLKLSHCDFHRNSYKLADILSDEAFVKIVKYMRENGKEAPIQQHTTLSWELLTDKEQEMLTTVVSEQSVDDSLPF